MAKRGFPIERHIEVGRRLDELQTELTHLLVEVNRHYPVSSPQVRRLNQTCDRLNGARSALDDAVYREHDEACAHIYYPAGQHWDVLHKCGTRRRA